MLRQIISAAVCHHHARNIQSFLFNLEFEMGENFRYFIAVPITSFESKHIGYHLKKLRIFLGKKQSSIAADTAHAPSTISDLERYGKNPNFNTIQDYIKSLGAEFYAFVPANFLSTEFDAAYSEFRLVQITSEKQLQKVARK